MSQLNQIKAHLNGGASLTQLEALEMFGCFRLAARIRDLRDSGMNIVSEPFKLNSGKFVAKYFKAVKHEQHKS